MNVDLPEPEGPMRNTNSPLSIERETLSSAGRAEDLYNLLTLSSVIITARQCSGGTRQAPTSYLGASGVAGTAPGAGVAVGGAVTVGVCHSVCGPRGPPGPSGSTTVVVGLGDVGLVVVSSGAGVVVSVVVVGAVVVVVYTGSFGRRTCVRGTQV
jgi:hypothetical protein